MEKSHNLLKVILLTPLLLFIAFLLFIFISVDNVFAQSASSYNIRFMNANGEILTSTTTSSLTYEGWSSYLLSANNFTSIGAGSYLYYNEKHTYAIRFNPNYTTITGLKVQYYYVTLSGDSIDITNFCTDSAVLTKDMTNSNSYLYQYKISSSCEVSNKYSTNSILIRIVPLYSKINTSYITRIAYNINSFNITNDPSESELIINNQNQNTSDIIDNNNQNTEDIINNQDINTDKIINNDDENTNKITQSQDKTTSAVKENTETNKSILEQIKALPQTLINGFLDMLKSLFIPSEEDLEDIINQSQEVSENFGFVGQSFSFIIDLFTSLLDLEQANGCIVLPALELKFGEILGIGDYTMWEEQNVCMSDNAWFGNDSEIINLIRTLLTIIAISAFVSWAVSQFNTILSKEDTST